MKTLPRKWVRPKDQPSFERMGWRIVKLTTQMQKFVERYEYRVLMEWPKEAHPVAPMVEAA